MFGEENIYKPEIKSNNDNNPNIIQNEINMQPESENIKKKEENNDNKNDLEDIKEKEDDLKLNDNNNKEEDKLENSPEKINDDNLNLNLNIHNDNINDNQFINGSNFKLINSIKKLETQSELSEISIHKEDFSSLYQKELNEYKKNILEEEISKIREQYNKNLKQKELEYEAQINELKEINQFTEETYNENTSVLKEQRNNFIKENLSLKSNLEKLTDELEFNKKQIQEYKNLVEHYKKLVEDNENNNKNNQCFILENDSENKGLEDSQNLINSAFVEKMESEKMILNNDIIELKNENESYKKEKEFYLNKNKKLEEENAENKNKIIKLEKTI